MRIYIDSIGEEFLQQGEDSGYRVTFRSELTCGTALLAANPGSDAPTSPGQELFVEVEAQAYEAVRTLSDQEAQEYRFTALPQAGCYELVGEVVYAARKNDPDYPMIAVRVADALFHWACDPSAGETLSIGTWVGFQIRSLVLWDKNL